MSTTLKVRLAFVIVTAGFTDAGLAAAESYPTRPIRLIVPSAMGGAPDVTSRVIANDLGRQMGQQVVVDNRPGAGGIIGFEALARAAPDGYTFGATTFNLISNYPPAKPGALICEPLKAAYTGSLTRPRTCCAT